MDSRRPACRRPAPRRGAPRRTRCGRPRYRFEPGACARLRPPLAPHHRQGSHRGPVRRCGRLRPYLRVCRLHRQVDGRCAHGVRGRGRAPPRGRRLRDQRLHAALLRPGDRPLRARPAPRRDGHRLHPLRCAPADPGGRHGGRARPRAGPPQARRGQRRRHVEPRGRHGCGSQPRGKSFLRPALPIRGPGRRRRVRRCPLRRRRVGRGRRGRIRGRTGIPGHPRPAGCRPGDDPAARPPGRSGRRPEEVPRRAEDA